MSWSKIFNESSDFAEFYGNFTIAEIYVDGDSLQIFWQLRFGIWTEGSLIKTDQKKFCLGN